MWRKDRKPLVLGTIAPFSWSPSIRLPTAERTGHMYVVGKTGKGKSKLLVSLLVQDILAGRGCGVIDPHSDLITDVLSLLHTKEAFETYKERIVYLNPAERRYIIPFNVLATPADPYELAQNIIESFRRAWPESLSAAPHFANIMLHALLLLIHAKYTLIDLPRVLTDKPFRERLLKSVNIPDVIEYFHTRFDAWSEKDPRLLESSLNKITALTLNPHIRLMLGQKENRLNLREIMDEGKVLLADLGHCGDESQRLIANLLTVGIEAAAFSRDMIPTAQRRPFYFYIDEFQDFVSDGGNGGGVKTLSKILSGARKYGLHLILANQNLSQLSERMIGAIIGNVWTKVIMGCSEQDAFIFARYIGLGSVDPHAVKHEAQTDTQHPVYFPLQEQENRLAAQLANQKPRQAIVRLQDGRTKTLWTLPITGQASEQILQDFRLELIERYGHPLGKVEKELVRLTEEFIPQVVPAYEVGEDIE